MMEQELIIIPINLKPLIFQPARCKLQDLRAISIQRYFNDL